MKKSLGNLSDYILVDTKTGEDKGFLTYKEIKYLDDHRNNGYVKMNDNIKKLKENKTDIQNLIEVQFGSFYFCKDKFLSKKDYIFRFLYLCTYMNYKNYIELGNGTNECRLIKKRDLSEIFYNLSRMEVYRTIKFFEENNMIKYDDNGLILVNNLFCVRGKCKAKGKIRIFDNTIKELYENTSSKEHKKLGLLIELLEYLNFNYNIVCKNPNEENPKLIEPLTLSELAKILGYSRSQRLKDALFNLRISEEKVIMIAKFDNANMVIVNPRVYYKGTKYADLKGIITLFEISKKY